MNPFMFKQLVLLVTFCLFFLICALSLQKEKYPSHVLMLKS